MSTLRSKEGYLMMDHRAGAGVPDSIMVPLGLPVGSGQGLFETPTYTCSHCNGTVVMHPLRKRERGYCRKCDANICDTCNVIMARNKECTPFEKLVDDILNQAAKGV